LSLLENKQYIVNIEYAYTDYNKLIINNNYNKLIMEKLFIKETFIAR